MGSTAARLAAEAADRGVNWAAVSATAALVLLPTFQKGALAKQQPVYKGIVGDGRQSDGTEAGAKEGLRLRVGSRLAIDCDGQTGCEDEVRDLGRHFSVLAFCKGLQHHKHTLCSRFEREGQRASWWPKTFFSHFLSCFLGFPPLTTTAFTNFTAPSPPKRVADAVPMLKPVARRHFLKSCLITDLSLSHLFLLSSSPSFFLSKVVFDRETGSG